MHTDTSFIPDVPDKPGSLTDYRKKAKFDWKTLRVYIEGEDVLRAKYAVWNQLEHEPLFKNPVSTESCDNQKKLAALRMKKVIEMKFLPEEMKQAAYQKRVKIKTFCVPLNQNFDENFFNFQDEIHDEPERSLSCRVSESFNKNGIG